MLCPEYDRLRLLYEAAMGGLIADSADWETFTSEWSEALSDAAIHGGELHMRQFAHSRGPFKGWPEEKRRVLSHRSF
jgi:hypothetical protein